MQKIDRDNRVKLIKQILNKVFKNVEIEIDDKYRDFKITIYRILDGIYQYLNAELNTIIFCHDFAKEFWGEEYISQPIYSDGEIVNDIGAPAWQYHLQQMVLEENPLKYLEKFL